jgi:UDP-N-acetylglucosamine 2-epimerase (non-hydrolysing)/GDP/UDP-N,N'-diacetylbacillosamine 2-epimerase (hydrolysing)
MKEVEADTELDLQIIASGMHLSHEFGMTFGQIKADGFKISKKVEMLLSSDNETAIIKSIGIGCLGFSDALYDLKPDSIVLLGDRFELLSAAISSLILKIPIIHIHGGETSQGVYDEAIRHSITKMAVLHFPATEECRKRIIQMGEDPDNIINFGAPGLDGLYYCKFYNKRELEDHLQFKLNEKVAIVTFHPVTLENHTSNNQIENLINAIQALKIKAIFTQANADTEGRLINEKIKKFCSLNSSRYKYIENLGYKIYLSCLNNFDLMIGNSSSGLIEAPSFKLPVVNIGARQKGREKAKNIIDVDYASESIQSGINIAISKGFRDSIKDCNNPYYKFSDGKISYRIKETIKKFKFTPEILKKQFYTINLKE